MKIKHKRETIKALYDKKESINLNPSWQRGPVWSDKIRSLLIDSILRDYDIPKIYLRELNESTPYKYEAVDGQQRLMTVWRFKDDDLRLSENLEEVGESSIAGKTYSQLAPQLKQKFNDFVVNTSYLQDSKEPEVSVLFSRMQMGVRLTPPELRNAIQSGLRHAIDGMAREHPFFKTSKISAARYKHQDYLAHAISLCIHDCKDDLKAPNLMTAYTEIKDSSIYAPVIDAGCDILDFLKEVNDKSKWRIKQKWIFVDLFYLLYKNRKSLAKLSPEEFSEAYTLFDKKRLKHNQKPEALIAGEHTKEDISLYEYINAFKISGAEKKNLQTRYEVLSKLFVKELEG